MEEMGGTSGVGVILYSGSRDELQRKLRARDDRITELEGVVSSQRDMLCNIAREAGFKAGEAYTWTEIVNRLRGTKERRDVC